MRHQNFVVWERKFTNLSQFICVWRGINRSSKRRFPFLDISIHSRDICDQSLKLSKNAWTVDVGWVEMSKYNFVVNKPKFTIFFVQRERNGG